MSDITDHYATAQESVNFANHESIGSPLADFEIARAQVEATLALVDAVRELAPLIREVGDQLDTIPRGVKA